MLTADCLGLSRYAIIVHGGCGRIQPSEGRQRLPVLQRAAEAGAELLRWGRPSLESVVRAVEILEDHPLFNAGRGSVLTMDGHVETDASLMTSDGRAAGVGALRGVRNSVRVAHRVMTLTRHVLMVGELPPYLTEGLRVPEKELITASRRAKHGELVRRTRRPSGGGTVGAVALDAQGILAAATSTGGTWLKLPGRVGDSAVVGVGTYVDGRGGASATGWGEGIIRLAIAREAVEAMQSQKTSVALRKVIEEASRAGVECGVIGIDATGRVGHAFNSPDMDVAIVHGKV